MYFDLCSLDSWYVKFRAAANPAIFVFTINLVLFYGHSQYAFPNIPNLQKVSKAFEALFLKYSAVKKAGSLPSAASRMDVNLWRTHW